MRLRLLTISLSLLAAPAAAGELEPLVLEFRALANGVHVEALAWRQDGEIFATRQIIADLGFDASGLAEGPVALSAANLVYRFIASEQAVEIACRSICGASQTIDLNGDVSDALRQGSGGFLNTEIVGERVGGEERFAASLDLGLFGPFGFGGSTWTIGAEDPGEVVRLETSWTFDLPRARQRLRFGDGITPARGGGRPIRFAGVQWGTDFNLDPSFITFPTPSFSGEAAMPSTIDLYLNGALQARTRVNAGPFELSDTPVAGGGEARIVVTDSLGREQIFGAPFYASPLLLRPGLVDFSVASGVSRTRFGRESFDYADAFLLGSYRRGLTDWATIEGRAEIRGDTAQFGVAVAIARPRLGELGLRSAVESGAGGEAMFGASWAWRGRLVNVALDFEHASSEFGMAGDEGWAQQRAQASLGVLLGRFGSLSLTGVTQKGQHVGGVETLGVTYQPRAEPWGALSFAALYVDDGHPFTTASINFIRPFGRLGSFSTSAHVDAGGASLAARVQTSPPGDAGWGWRLEGVQGARERVGAGLMLRGRTFDASIEAASAGGQDGLRGQFSTAVAWIDGDTRRSRTIRDGFAMVDASVAGVAVTRDHVRVGRTDRSGRLLVTGLRAYDGNRIGIDIDDLPITHAVEVDEIMVRIPERSGARVSFHVTAPAGEVRIVDAAGVFLPDGAILVRDIDRVRFPVGQDGRVYLFDVSQNATLTAVGDVACRVVLTADALANDEPLTCDN